jgi:hypothetical protein
MGRVKRLLVGNETVTMLGLARILGLILVRLGSTRTTTLQHDTIMLRAAAVAHTITHRRMLARRSDNHKKIQGKKVRVVT